MDTTRSMLLEPPPREDLADILRAYHDVADKLQQSHEQLVDKVERLQAELASADAQLQRSKRLAALGEMAAGIAHEVRNPLAGIQLYAQMIAQDLAGRSGLEPVAEQARKIVSAVAGLDAIVHDVLMFARQLTPRCRTTDLLALVCRVIDELRPVWGGVEVEVSGRPLVSELDEGLIRQAMHNLLRNAAEAMREHAGKVTVEVKRVRSRAVVRVTDQGPGIDEAVLDRIFNPFFTTRSTGTGLGLAIVHRIAEAHGGSIAAWNRPAVEGTGAVFEMNLPLSPGLRPV